MSAKVRKAIHVWAVVDTEYMPYPIAVDASASKDWALGEAMQRNDAAGHPRFRVVKCTEIEP